MHIDVLVPAYILRFLEVEYQATRYEIDLGKSYRIRSRFTYEDQKAYIMPPPVEVSSASGTVRLVCPPKKYTFFASTFQRIAHEFERPDRSQPDVQYRNFFSSIFLDVLSGYVNCARDLGLSEAEAIRRFMKKYDITDELIEMGSIQRLLQRARPGR